jgi:hypothetical protein
MAVEGFSAPKKLVPYIDAAEKSSQRARSVVALITITSVLAFASFWNSRDDSWFQQRLNSAEFALKYFDSSCDLLSDVDRADCQRAKGFIAERNIRVKEHLEHQVQYMNQADVENVTLIRIPFFGVTFDVNDLGVLSGIAFSILLFWLMYALVSERHDVRFIFRTAAEKPELLLVTYRLLAMRQVLSVPPLLVKQSGGQPDEDNEATNRRWLNGVSKCLFLMPVAVHFTILYNDYHTISKGSSISVTATMGAMAAAVGLSIVIAVLTAICVRISNLTDREWVYARDLIQRGQNGRVLSIVPGDGLAGTAE